MGGTSSCFRSRASHSTADRNLKLCPQCSLLAFVFFVFASCSDFCAARGAALAAVELLNGAPEIQLTEIRLGQFVEFRTRRIDLVAVGKNFSAGKVSRENDLQLLELIVTDLHHRLLLAGGVAAAANIFEQGGKD